MNSEEVFEIAKTIYKQVVRPNMMVYFSWGVSKKFYTIYREMATLGIKVSARLFKGYVMICYNRGTDSYDIYLRKTLKADGELVRGDVYFDELQDVIDKRIESGYSASDYEAFVKRNALKEMLA